MKKFIIFIFYSSIILSFSCCDKKPNFYLISFGNFKVYFPQENNEFKCKNTINQGNTIVFRDTIIGEIVDTKLSIIKSNNIDRIFTGIYNNYHQDLNKYNTDGTIIEFQNDINNTLCFVGYKEYSIIKFKYFQYKYFYYIKQGDFLLMYSKFSFSPGKMTNEKINTLHKSQSEYINNIHFSFIETPADKCTISHTK